MPEAFFTYRADKCLILRYPVSDVFVLASFSSPRSHFHLFLEFRICQRASLSSGWFYRAHGEWKLNVILEAVHYDQGGVGLLSSLGCIWTWNRKERTEAMSHFIWAQDTIYLECGEKLKQEFLCYFLHGSCPIQYILNGGLWNGEIWKKNAASSSLACSHLTF